MKAIAVLLVSLALVSACSGSDASVTSDSSAITRSTTSPPEASATIVDAPATSAADAPFDPDDAAWVIQQDATIVVLGVDGIGSFSPTSENSRADETNPDGHPTAST